jgi:5-methylcytosine-specific restriction endonuclease McrA
VGNLPADLVADVSDLDAFGLDARLREAMRAIRTAEPQVGRYLRLLVDQHLYRALGFRSVDAYVRERLGISPRKAWALIKVEKTARRAPAFAEAYAAGTLSWVRALTILPVADRQTAGVWITRARTVTVRRLMDSVITEWEAQPRHRDPVFVRDGWRCRVPACSAHRELQDHHITFRSRGGNNARRNRIAICAAHHLHGIHAGAPTLLTFLGDRLCDAGDEAAARQGSMKG